MDIASVDVACEEREEGEIVEDDLEDVSDCSMSSGSPFFIGKSVSPPELLSAVCLSSVSSSEYSAGDGRCCVRDLPFPYFGKDGGRRRMHKRKRKLEDHSSKRKRCHHSRHHRKPGDSDADSANEVVDPKYAKKLRVALRRESTQDLLHNSLRTRLKAFIEPSSHSEDELSLNALRDLALLSTFKTAENLDKPIGEVESEEFQCIDELTNDENQKIDEQHVADNEDSNEFREVQDADESKKDENVEEEEINLKMLDKAETQSVESDDQIFDSELRELRIAALKSFVLENHNRRRRKAAVENHSNNKDDANDVDKENDKSIINSDLEGKSSKKLVGDPEKDSENALEVPIVDNSAPKTDDANADDGNCTDCRESLEDDADILRTMLLASMSKKLAGKTMETASSPKALGFPRTLLDLRKVEKSKMNHNSLSVTITKPFFRTIKNDLYSITNTNHLKNNKIGEQSHLPTNVVVKPLIINVNADSDSDTDNLVTVNENNKALKATVTEFLKKQRAEVEASVKRKPHDSPESNLNKSYDPLMEKSVMQLLPQSQQLEYRRLKQQLINARKKMRIRKPSQRLSESKRENGKKVPKVKTDITTNNSETVNTKTIKNAQEKKSVQPAGNLQQALNELQIRKNGRLSEMRKLQIVYCTTSTEWYSFPTRMEVAIHTSWKWIFRMKGKYRALAPLLHRINQASNDRRQHEIEIKKLLLQIQKARTKLAASHQIFTTLVQQLLCEKNTIDQGVLKMIKFSPNTQFTSTPNKLIKNAQTCEISSVNENCSMLENNNGKTDSTKVNNTQIAGNITSIITTESEELKSTNQNNNQKLEKEVLLDPSDKNEGVLDPINNKDEVLLDPDDKTEEMLLDSNEVLLDPIDNKDEVLLDPNDKKEEMLLDSNDMKQGMLLVPNDVEEVLLDSNVRKEEVLLDPNDRKEDMLLLDPNDITKVFVEHPMLESMTFPKYTSPLHNRDGITDPLTTICPYDLLGVCKDKECRYMHCS